MLITIRLIRFIKSVIKHPVIIVEDDWNAIQETRYLNSVPGMTESLIKGKKTPLEDCLSEDEVGW